jgi:hypothetical protein
MFKADDVKAAFGDGANNTDSAFFTLAATSKVGQVPDGWKGQFVRMTPFGANMWYFFSTNPAAAIAIGAASDGGTQSATQGEYVPTGTTARMLVPYAPEGSHVYFVRIGDAAGTGVSITKASGKPGENSVQGE